MEIILESFSMRLLIGQRQTFAEEVHLVLTAETLVHCSFQNAPMLGNGQKSVRSRRTLIYMSVGLIPFQFVRCCNAIPIVPSSLLPANIGQSFDLDVETYSFKAPPRSHEKTVKRAPFADRKMSLQQ